MIMVPLTVGNRKSAVMEKLSVENDVRGLFILGVCIIYSLVLFTIAAATHAAFVIVRTALGACTTEAVITITVATSKTIIRKSKSLPSSSHRG
ncbi:hypothetical protein NP493_506g02044 [Ridgeia piscesae]|uniref:Uncharacterized protein n=1 Tax=Ridgeia piscesae TaxID=27915 RepID=A0AAD9KXL6_RIDPI|nr:hypothetical protein NP493_506g02044 [Ridgeia piscesae]